MVWITESFDDGSPLRATGLRVLPLLLLEGCLLAVILWRIAHHVYWKSHPRRVFFHLVLLVSCVLRAVFWVSLGHAATLLAPGIALLWWANSLLLLCTASIIIQWWCAVSVGRVAVRELQRVKRFSLQHPLVVLHAIHLLTSLAGGITLMVRHPRTAAAMQDEAHRARLFLRLFHLLNAVIVTIDAVVAFLVSRRLRERLLSAAMADDMKRKSVIQMTLLITAISASLALEMIVSAPPVVVGLERAFGSLRLSLFCVLAYFLPGLFLSLAFLYIMRRVEQREPVRLVALPTASSLVEFEECSAPSPCMWCEHHRRFHVGQNKWDVAVINNSPASFFSPRTIESNFRAMQSTTVAASGGTFPADLETPIAWSSTMDDSPAILGGHLSVGSAMQSSQNGQRRQSRHSHRHLHAHPHPHHHHCHRNDGESPMRPVDQLSASSREGRLV
ncbi:hypothetical protein PINS_up011607 [Pythium insidiosum]|nr:hypothetical protein PINS_up011607 [Pythium insidiosum]